MSELKELQNALLHVGSGIVQKSVGSMTKVEKAHAITEASKTPTGQIIAKRIIQLERQRAVRKAMGLEDADDLFDKIKENEREHAQLVQQLKAARARQGNARSDEDEDEWSAMFSEV